MFKYEAETWKVASMDELLALARSMEQEAIEGYLSLSRRMSEMGRLDLAEVFDSLVLEEQGHLGKVDDWREGLGQTGAVPRETAKEEMFDDEGTAMVAPELLSAYRAFSMAVRNEERAFVFWSYVSAHAESADIMKAAETIAREELGHVAKLRRERRRAFHAERDNSLEANDIDLHALEERFSRQLVVLSEQGDPARGPIFRALLGEADFRRRSIAERPFSIAPAPQSPPRTAVENAAPLAEFLLDCYLDIGDRSPDEQDTARGRAFAAQVIHCLGELRR